VCADPFSQSISEFKDSITNSKAPLEEQLAQVQSRIASHSSQELDAIKDLQAQLDAAGVTNVSEKMNTTPTHKTICFLFSVGLTLD
jgi:hypothetical protein